MTEPELEGYLASVVVWVPICRIMPQLVHRVSSLRSSLQSRPRDGDTTLAASSTMHQGHDIISPFEEN